jgi:hypothetical protein
LQPKRFDGPLTNGCGREVEVAAWRLRKPYVLSQIGCQGGGFWCSGCADICTCVSVHRDDDGSEPRDIEEVIMRAMSAGFEFMTVREYAEMVER